jgi:hypothetical protein
MARMTACGLGIRRAQSATESAHPVGLAARRRLLREGELTRIRSRDDPARTVQGLPVRPPSRAGRARVRPHRMVGIAPRQSGTSKRCTWMESKPESDVQPFLVGRMKGPGAKGSLGGGVTPSAVRAAESRCHRPGVVTRCSPSRRAPHRPPARSQRLTQMAEGFGRLAKKLRRTARTTNRRVLEAGLRRHRRCKREVRAIRQSGPRASNLEHRLRHVDAEHPSHRRSAQVASTCHRIRSRCQSPALPVAVLPPLASRHRTAQRCVDLSLHRGPSLASCANPLCNLFRVVSRHEPVRNVLQAR